MLLALTETWILTAMARKIKQGLDPAKSLFDKLGLDPEDVLKVDYELNARPAKAKRDHRINICGHPVARVTNANGIVYCKPTRMECPAKKLRPMLEVSDLRFFLRRTEGGGALHALTRGLAALEEAGGSAKWLEDLVCDRCGRADGGVVPVPVTINGIQVSRATGFDAMLCKDCREAI